MSRPRQSGSREEMIRIFIPAFPFTLILALQAYVPSASLHRKTQGSEEYWGIHIVDLEPIAALFLIDAQRHVR